MSVTDQWWQRRMCQEYWGSQCDCGDHPEARGSPSLTQGSVEMAGRGLTWHSRCCAVDHDHWLSRLHPTRGSSLPAQSNHRVSDRPNHFRDNWVVRFSCPDGLWLCTTCLGNESRCLRMSMLCGVLEWIVATHDMLRGVLEWIMATHNMSHGKWPRWIILNPTSDHKNFSNSIPALTLQSRREILHYDDTALTQHWIHVLGCSRHFICEYSMNHGTMTG